MKYRADIDGLRAFAVVPVMLYHFGFHHVAGLPLAPGGFVGVDVFFVISGYLITRIIYDEMRGGQYSLANFYVRRIRRIFPALMLVYLACLVFSLALHVPHEVVEVSRTVVSSVLFVSNLYFSTKSGYFDVALQSNPLLHTWSLSVEEQFYIIFPFVIYFVRGHSKRVVLAWVASLGLLSFGYSEFAVDHDRSMAFYGVHSRAWELSLGALLAILRPSAPANFWIRNTLASVGLILLVLCVVLYDKSMRFPGVAALLPCLATVLVIYAGGGSKTWVGTLLSCSPIRWTGLLSYSLYLWHWPIVVFYKSEFFLNKSVGILLILLCFCIAAISWKYVEQPFRNFGDKAGQISVLRGGAAAMIVIVCAALVLPVVAQWYWNPNTDVKRLSEYSSTYDPDAPMRAGKCFINSRYSSMSLYSEADCLRVDDKLKNVLVIGDSHSAHLIYGLMAEYPRVNFMQASVAGCVPSVSLEGEADSACAKLMGRVMREFLPQHRLDAIVFAARWKVEDANAAFVTAEYLSKYADKVLIVGRNVEYDSALPRLLARASMKDDSSFVEKHRSRVVQKIDLVYKSITLPKGVEYISLYDLICPVECRLWVDGNPINFDDNHLSTNGSLFVAKSIGHRLFGV